MRPPAFENHERSVPVFFETVSKVGPASFCYKSSLIVTPQTVRGREKESRSQIVQKLPPRNLLNVRGAPLVTLRVISLLNLILNYPIQYRKTVDCFVMNKWLKYAYATTQANIANSQMRCTYLYLYGQAYWIIFWRASFPTKTWWSGGWGASALKFVFIRADSI